jgi:hypothetical protein
MFCQKKTDTPLPPELSSSVRPTLPVPRRQLHLERRRRICSERRRLEFTGKISPQAVGTQAAGTLDSVPQMLGT